MGCDRDRLQQYLDWEMDAAESKEVERHLNSCRACRQEVARLRLLWLEMEEPEAVEIPPALPYLRQQAVTEFKRSQERAAQTGITFRESLELAWEPAFRWASFLPSVVLPSKQNRPTSPKPPSEGVSVWSIGKRVWRLTQRGRKDK